MSEHSLQSVYDALRQVYDSIEPVSSGTPYSSSTPQASVPRRNGPRTDQSMRPTIPDLDLRDLEYLDSDPHLSCPICHIPFVDPVFVDCGHYFCEECLARYWETTTWSGGRRPCPTCRSTVRSNSCAPRLIVNMCNDVRVKCPMKECGQTTTRGTLESHMLLYCPERLFECPDLDCKGKTKRKHFLPGQCRHKTHQECECGDLVLLDILERHKRLQCSSGVSTCSHCQQPVGPLDAETHSCEARKHCPGNDFGCDAFLDPQSLEEHLRRCTIAKIVPHLKAHVTNSLAPLRDELFRFQQRVKGLEEGIDRILEAVDSRLQDSRNSRNDEVLLDTSLPAHSHSDQPTSSASSSSNTERSATESAEHRHLLALHEDLCTSVMELALNLGRLSCRVEEVDASNSMLTMNETLRLKEELSLVNNGLFSTRTQVQWLLNRERTGQQPGIRGRVPPLPPPPPPHHRAGQTPIPPAHEPTPGTNENVTDISYNFLPPAARRTRTTSGGSQERVKL